MKHRSVVINSLPQAYEVIKEMNLDHDDADYRSAGRQSLAAILEGRMQERITYYLDEMARLGEVDRRNGYFSRHLLTELGDIELSIPRTRRFSAVSMLRAYARRAPQINRMILACFVLGISTRKVSQALLPVFRGTHQCKYGLPGGSELGYSGSCLSSEAHKETVPVFALRWGGAQTKDGGGIGQASGVSCLGDYQRRQKGGH